MSSKKDSLAVQHEPFIKRFTFSDGTVKETCSVKGCAYGRGGYASTSVANQQINKHTLGELPMLMSDDEDDWDVIDKLAAQLALDAKSPEPQAGAGDDEEVEVEDLDGNVTTILKSELETAGDDPTFEESEGDCAMQD